MSRIAIALMIAVGVYGAALAAGSILYASDAIGTGATHNDCVDYRHEIARERGISDEDVPQTDVNARTRECLATHELRAEDAFRSEFLFWAIWPALISGAGFFLWAPWSRALERQELAEVAREASHLEPGA